MKKILAVLLAVLMLVMCTACGAKNEGDSDNVVYDANHVFALPESVSASDCENPVTYFSVSLTNNATGEMKSLIAYENEVSGCDIQYTGEEKKVAKFNYDALYALTAEFENSGLAALNGQFTYEEGDMVASIYVSYADGTSVMADLSGVISDEFTNGYNAMESFFKTITEQVPVYVPQPVVMGEIDETVHAEMLSILNNSKIDALDSFTISAVAMDDTFGYMTGLSSNEGIVNGTVCNPMMMTTPYSLVIVTVEDTANVETVRADFENSMDWLKWVCVAPTNAVIAEKDNMVLCLMASDDFYNNTADAISAAGWSELKELSNPNM